MIDFGDYVNIEMFRHGSDNEIYKHKVIGSMMSSHSVNVPIRYGEGGTGHDEVSKGMHDVLAVVQCGVSETHIFKVALRDIQH